MAICAHCKTQETEVYEKNGAPICLACATDKAADIQRVERATAHSAMDGTGINLPKDLKRAR